MQLGAFSISLNVKDISVSRDFYANLGFEEIGGNIDENWLILRNGDHVIGLFQGMFDRNLMTFNPGWDSQCNEIAEFTDVRDIQQSLKAAGIPLDSEADPETAGPASIMLTDPDGNPILIDQHR